MKILFFIFAISLSLNVRAAWLRGEVSKLSNGKYICEAYNFRPYQVKVRSVIFEGFDDNGLSISKQFRFKKKVETSQTVKFLSRKSFSKLEVSKCEFLYRR